MRMYGKTPTRRAEVSVSDDQLLQYERMLRESKAFFKARDLASDEDVPLYFAWQRLYISAQARANGDWTEETPTEFGVRKSARLPPRSGNLPAHWELRSYPESQENTNPVLWKKSYDTFEHPNKVTRGSAIVDDIFTSGTRTGKSRKSKNGAAKPGARIQALLGQLERELQEDVYEESAHAEDESTVRKEPSPNDVRRVLQRTTSRLTRHLDSHSSDDKEDNDSVADRTGNRFKIGQREKEDSTSDKMAQISTGLHEAFNSASQGNAVAVYPIVLSAELDTRSVGPGSDMKNESSIESKILSSQHLVLSKDPNVRQADHSALIKASEPSPLETYVKHGNLRSNRSESTKSAEAGCNASNEEELSGHAIESWLRPAIKADAEITSKQETTKSASDNALKDGHEQAISVSRHSSQSSQIDISDKDGEENFESKGIDDHSKNWSVDNEKEVCVEASKKLVANDVINISSGEEKKRLESVTPIKSRSSSEGSGFHDTPVNEGIRQAYEAQDDQVVRESMGNHHDFMVEGENEVTNEKKSENEIMTEYSDREEQFFVNGNPSGGTSPDQGEGGAVLKESNCDENGRYNIKQHSDYVLADNNSFTPELKEPVSASQKVLRVGGSSLQAEVHSWQNCQSGKQGVSPLQDCAQIVQEGILSDIQDDKNYLARVSYMQTDNHDLKSTKARPDPRHGKSRSRHSKMKQKTSLKFEKDHTGIAWPPGMKKPGKSFVKGDFHPCVPPGLEHLVSNEEMHGYWQWLYWYSAWQMWYLGEKKRKKGSKRGNRQRSRRKDDEIVNGQDKELDKARKPEWWVAL